MILSVKDLVVKFRLRDKELTAIRNLSLDLKDGECLAIVGESGSGKSVLTKTFIGLLDKNGWIESGSIYYKDIEISKFENEEDWRAIRGKEIGMVFQEPMSSLNPLRTIGSQVKESIVLHSSLKGKAARKEAVNILKDVGISEAEKRYGQYPHEFSGGMRQRVVIAIAIASRPKILICDEPTTALDVTIQAQILKLIKTISRKYKLTTVFITHDLGVVANVADRVAVMYAGDIIEIGKVEDIFYNPKHPYTWSLLLSLPQLARKGDKLYSSKGTTPNLLDNIVGDPYAPRNPYALNIDFLKKPPYYQVSGSHKVKSWLMDPRAPYVELPKNVRYLRQGLWRDRSE